MLTIIIFILLSALALFLWLASLAASSSLHNSDNAGNALARLYCIVELALLWLLLGTLLIISIATDRIEIFAIFALPLLPISAVSSIISVDLLANNRRLKWPLATLALIPALNFAYLAWCWIPWLNSRLNPTAAGVCAFLPILLLAPIPMIHRNKLTRLHAANQVNDPK